MTEREKIRSAALKTPAFRSTEIELEDGTKIELREPTAKSRAEIFRRSRLSDGTLDRARQQVEAVILCAFVPGTDQLVFEAADADMLFAQPVGGWFERAQLWIFQTMNTWESAPKNLQATPPSS